MFVDHERDDIDDQRFDQIERQNAAENEAELVVDDWKNGVSHANDGLQRQMEPAYVERNDEQIVGSRSDDGHAQRSDQHRQNGAFLCPVFLIDEGRADAVDR